MSEQRSPDTCELRQTREPTATEQRDLLDLWGKAVWPKGAGTWFATSYYLYYAFGAFFALSVWMSVSQLAPLAPERAGQLSIAAIGFAGSLALFHWISARLQRKLYWRRRSDGDRYVVETKGFRRIGDSSDLFILWRGVDGVICTDRYVAVLCGGAALLLAKAAFAGQDVDGFCGELQRRWNGSRAQTT